MSRRARNRHIQGVEGRAVSRLTTAARTARLRPGARPSAPQPMGSQAGDAYRFATRPQPHTLPVATVARHHHLHRLAQSCSGAPPCFVLRQVAFCVQSSVCCGGLSASPGGECFSLPARTLIYQCSTDL